MGMLNKQKNIQIAALNARGMTVEAIAKKAGVDVQAVKESLEERQRTYIELSAWNEYQIKAYISVLQSKGKSVSEIAELTGLNAKKVNEIIFKKAEEELPEVGKVEIESAAPAKRGGHSRLTELIKNKIIELKQQGKSDAAIAKELGIGKSSVYRTWTEHKGEGKPSKINEEFEKAVDDMIEENKGKEITEEREEMPKEKAAEAEKVKACANDERCANNALLMKCQKELPLIEKDFLTMYEGMTEAEQRAWDLGEMFGRIIRLRSEFI